MENNNDIEKIKAIVSNLQGTSELIEIIEEKKSTYSFFIKSRCELLDDYLFRLQETRDRGVEVEGLEYLVNNLKESKEDNIRVNGFTIGELDYMAVYTDECITKLFGVIR